MIDWEICGCVPDPNYSTTTCKTSTKTKKAPKLEPKFFEQQKTQKKNTAAIANLMKLDVKDHI